MHRNPYDLPLGDALTETLADGWAPEPPTAHRAAAGSAEAAARHRATLAPQFPGSALVIPSGSAPVRVNDNHHTFRPTSQYAYLTGDQAEQGVLVLRPAGEATEALLFLPQRFGPGSIEYMADRRAGGVWIGGVPDGSTTAAHLAITVRPRDELASTLASLGSDVRLMRGVDHEVDTLLPAADDRGLAGAIDEARSIKDAWEIDRLDEACAATARGFADVARELPRVLAGGGRRGERWLEGTFWRRARFEGNDVGYSSVVAAGPNGTSLHWAPVDGDIEPGQLLLADMGVESTSLYTADITRTLPVDGTYTIRQRQVYDAVHEANRAGVAEVRAGNPYLAAHHAAQWVLADHLRSWGVIDVKPDDALHPDLTRPGSNAHRRYSLHATSHMLGLDVHDCLALTPGEYVGINLRAGHCLTVEPGLYFQVNDLTVPAELRGIAVRIEDDVVATATGPRVLSDSVPVASRDVEQWIRDVQQQEDLTC